jgi:hypothetical protein
MFSVPIFLQPPNISQFLPISGPSTSGNIVMAPLFVDESVLLKYLGILLCTVTYWIIRCNSDSSIVLPGTMVCSL